MTQDVKNMRELPLLALYIIRATVVAPYHHTSFWGHEPAIVGPRITPIDSFSINSPPVFPHKNISIETSTMSDAEPAHIRDGSHKATESPQYEGLDYI